MLLYAKYYCTLLFHIRSIAYFYYKISTHHVCYETQNGKHFYLHVWATEKSAQNNYQQNHSLKGDKHLSALNSFQWPRVISHQSPYFAKSPH